MNKKKASLIIVTVVVLVLFFFFPIIPGSAVFMTEKQKDERDVFCSEHSCGLVIMISPYEYLKKSLANFISQE